MAEADYGKALSEFWTMGNQSLLAAQQGVLRALNGGANGAASAAAPSGGDAAEAIRALTGLWSSALGMSSALAGSLPAASAEGDGTVATTVRRMMDPRTWASGGDGLDEALQRLAEGPRLADAGEMERRVAKVSRAWLALRQRSLEHQAVVLEGWMRAGQNFAARLAERNGKGEPATSSRQVLDLWVETANHALLEMQRSEPFLRGQAGLLKASTDLRFAQREIADHYADSYGLPSRRELDDVHRTVTELRRELRALQRQARVAAEPRAAVGAEKRGTTSTERRGPAAGDPSGAAAVKPREAAGTKASAAPPAPEPVPEAARAPAPKTGTARRGSAPVEAREGAARPAEQAPGAAETAARPGGTPRGSAPKRRNRGS